jgi:predicted TIM-barrel enzyme
VSGFGQRFPRHPIMIGMIHLPPLPGFAGCPGIDQLIEHALRDLETLEACGFDGVLVENENDRPHAVMASSEVLLAMTRVTDVVVAAARNVVIGCEILLNDPRASLLAARGSMGNSMSTRLACSNFAQIGVRTMCSSSPTCRSNTRR